LPFTSHQSDAAEVSCVPLLTKMFSERTLAVQAALMQQPEKVLALIVWRMCTCVFSGYLTTAHPFSISQSVFHCSLTENAPSGKSCAAFEILMTEKACLKALLPAGWEKGFTTFFTLDGGVLISLMAFCSARRGVQSVCQRFFPLRTGSTRITLREIRLFAPVLSAKALLGARDSWLRAIDTQIENRGACCWLQLPVNADELLLPEETYRHT